MSNIYLAYYLNTLSNDLTSLNVKKLGTIAANGSDSLELEKEKFILDVSLNFVQKEYGNIKCFQCKEILKDNNFDYVSNIESCENFIGIYLKKESNKIILYEKLPNSYQSGWLTTYSVPSKIDKLGEFGSIEVDMSNNYQIRKSIAIPNIKEFEESKYVPEEYCPANSKLDILSELKKFNEYKSKKMSLKDNLKTFTSRPDT